MGSLPLQCTSRRLPSVFLAAFTCATVIFSVLPFASAASGPFANFERNQITGRWTERTRGVGGTAIGGARGERLQIHVESAGFAAELMLLTRNPRQNVTIDSQGGGQIVKASITLNRS
jgi:hypothetical protein